MKANKCLAGIIHEHPTWKSLKEQAARKVDAHADWLVCSSAQVQRYIIDDQRKKPAALNVKEVIQEKPAELQVQSGGREKMKLN